MLNQLAIKETPWLALQPGLKNPNQTKKKGEKKERKKRSEKATKRLFYNLTLAKSKLRHASE